MPHHKLRVYFEEDIRVWFTRSGKHFFQKEILLPYQEEAGVYNFQGRIFTWYSAN